MGTGNGHRHGHGQEHRHGYKTSHDCDRFLAGCKKLKLYTYGQLDIDTLAVYQFLASYRILAVGLLPKMISNGCQLKQKSLIFVLHKTKQFYITYKIMTE